MVYFTIKGYYLYVLQRIEIENHLIRLSSNDASLKVYFFFSKEFSDVVKTFALLINSYDNLADSIKIKSIHIFTIE